jgi:hypothetical protein
MVADPRLKAVIGKNGGISAPEIYLYQVARPNPETCYIVSVT